MENLEQEEPIELKISPKKPPKKWLKRTCLAIGGLTALLGATNISLIDRIFGPKAVYNVSRVVPVWDVNSSSRGYHIVGAGYGNAVYLGLFLGHGKRGIDLVNGTFTWNDERKTYEIKWTSEIMNTFKKLN